MIHATAEIERQARMLATENRKAEPAITSVYWFPDGDEVRLVELLPTLPLYEDDALTSFYFSADPSRELPFPSRVALIRPEQFGMLQLPISWGAWTDAILIDEKK